MSSYLILLFGLLLIWTAAFLLNGREIGAPASLVCAMFLFTAILCTLGYGSWNTVDLGMETISILWTGCMAFAMGGSLAFHRGTKEKIFFYPEAALRQERSLKYQIEPWKLAVLILGLFLIAYVRVNSIQRIATEAGQGNLSFTAMTKWYRDNFSRLFGVGTVLSGVGESFAEKQILRFATVIANTAVIVFLIGFSGKDKHVIWGGTALLAVYFVYILLTDGGRATVLFKAAMIAYGIYILQLRNGVPNWKMNRTFLLIGVIAILVAFPLFYYSSTLVGRKAKGGMTDYLTFYYGCGIPSLELQLRQGIQDHPFGQNVFYGVYTLLYKVGLVNHLGGYANEWQNLNGYESNVYTAWYRYYADFGMLGVAGFAFLYGWFFTWLYQKVKTGENLAVWCLFFAWGHSLFDLSRDDYLFGQFLGTAPLINLALSVIMVCFVCIPAGPVIRFETERSQKIEGKKGNRFTEAARKIRQWFKAEPIHFCLTETSCGKEGTVK